MYWAWSRADGWGIMSAQLWSCHHPTQESPNFKVRGKPHNKLELMNDQFSQPRDLMMLIIWGMRKGNTHHHWWAPCVWETQGAPRPPLLRANQNQGSTIFNPQIRSKEKEWDSVTQIRSDQMFLLFILTGSTSLVPEKEATHFRWLVPFTWP